jgi:MFS family permease
MPVFMVAGVLQGIGSGVMLPALGTIVVTLCPADRKGAANGTLFSAVDLGIGAGALVWGVLAGFTGYGGVFLACAGCIVMAALVYWLTLRGQIQVYTQAHPGMEKI